MNKVVFLNSQNIRNTRLKNATVVFEITVNNVWMMGFCWSIKRFSVLPLKLQISQTGSIANWGYWQSIISQWTTQSCANKGKAKVPLPCDRFRFGFFYQLKTSNWQKSIFIIRGEVQQSFESVPFHVTLKRKARTTTLCFTQWRKQHSVDCLPCSL